MDKHVSVIGAGLGGLSTAIYLATRGYKVQIFEQNTTPGGKMNEFRHGDFRFDTGPSLLTMPFILNELFTAAGLNLADELNLVPIDPICRYFWDDGSAMDTHSDAAHMSGAITKLSVDDAKRYPAFLDYSRRIYDLTADIFLFSPIHEKHTMFRWKNLPTLFRIHQIDPFRTVHQGVQRFFSDKRLVQLFDRYATYNGSNPYMAPATLNIIPYVEYGLGGFYVAGGMYRLVEKLESIAASLGVTFQFNTRVEKIAHDRGKIQGIIANGDFVRTDVVVCNADVVNAFNTLIADFPKYRQQLNSMEPSLSGIVFLWNMKGTYPQLVHHNILFSGDYKQEFDALCKQQAIPDDPTVYIAITSKHDRDHAAPDSENWFVLVNAPYLNDTIDWQEAVISTRQAILNKMKRHGFDVAPAIQGELTITPEDFFVRYGSNRGSIYGLSSNNRTSAFRRPANRSRQISGLYFAGGSTHPGGGVPLAILSGKICADLIGSGQ